MHLHNRNSVFVVFLIDLGEKKEMEVVLIKIKAIILSISRWIESEGSYLS